MEVTLEKEEKYSRLKINITEEDYKPKVSEKLKEYSKKANIKGFRPGKVPQGLIQKMYGKSILVDEINHIISHSINDYIKNEKLNVVGDPMPAEENNQIDWDNQKEFEFRFKLGVVPKFTVDLSKLKETKYSIKIDDKIVNETLDNLKDQFGEMEEVESVEDEDFLTGDIKDESGDFSKEDAMLSVDKLSTTGKKAFKGKKAGEEVTFDIQKAFIDAAAIGVTTGHSKEEAEQLSGKYTFTVKTIKRKKPAEINQEFYDRVFGKDAVKSDEEFMGKLKDTIAENYSRETDMMLDRDIQNQLVANTDMEIPDDFLKDWLLKANEGKFDKETIDAQYDQFKNDLKWNLIRNEIVEKNDLKAEHEDIMAKAKEGILQQFGNMPMNPEMDEMLNKVADNYLKQDNGKAYMQTFEAVLLDKVIAYLKENVEIKEKEVTLDEFKKVIEKM